MLLLLNMELEEYYVILLIDMQNPIIDNKIMIKMKNHYIIFQYFMPVQGSLDSFNIIFK